MEFVIVQLQGHQYKIVPGSKVCVDRLNETSEFKTDKVLMYQSDKEILFGRPFVPNVEVSFKVNEQKLGKKLRIQKFHRRKRFRKTQGYRSKLTELTVNEIINTNSK